MTMEWIQKWGVIATSLTAIFTVILYLYNKIITEPRNKRNNEVKRRLNDKLIEKLDPLDKAIAGINHLLEINAIEIEIIKDANRKQTDQITNNRNKLSDHEVRIEKLEWFREDHQDRIRKGGD